MMQTIRVGVVLVLFLGTAFAVSTAGAITYILLTCKWRMKL